MQIDDPEQLHTLLDCGQDKIVVVDETGTYRYANAAVERILGFDREAFVGTNTFEYMHPDDCDRVRDTFERLLETDERRVDTVEYRHRTKDGSWVWLESRMGNESVAELGGYVVSSREITDRKRAKQRQKETEARLEELAANTNDVLWMFDADWENLLFVNSAFEDIWGLSIDELKRDPQRFLERIHPEDEPRVTDAMARISAGESVEMEYRVAPDREYRRWVWVKATPIFEDGDVVRIAGFARDVTDRRRRERQLQVMDTLLRHNLRNDMNVILGHAEMAREYGDEAIEQSMNVIEKTGSRLLSTAEKEREIVDILLDLEGPATVDLAETVRCAVDDIRKAHTGLTVDVTGPDSLEAVALEEIGVAVHELLENAVEHTDCEPHVGVSLQVDSTTAIVEITDNGPPIPENEIEPLSVESDTSELYHGTGLGLWLVYWIVDLSEGEIDFEPSQQGNTVRVTLPKP